jgi:hypothetical protein
MQYAYIDYDHIHDVVDSSDAFWDGYEAVFINRRRDGYADLNGMFIDGQWVTVFRSGPDKRGLWKVPVRHVKSA